MHDETPAAGFTGGVIVFYGLLAAVAVLWMWVRGEPLHRVWSPGEPEPLWLQVTVGLGFGLAVVAVGRAMERHFEFARKLSAELRAILPPLRPLDIAVAAVFSSVGEELFFRGAMQDHFGVWPTVLVFGVVHGFFDRRFITWMVFALVMGAAFGMMTVALGTLLAPVLAHFTINFVNLHLLVEGKVAGP